MNHNVYKIEDNNINMLKDLEINEYCPIEDNNGNKIIINKLLSNGSKLYLETTYLKVIEIDYDSKKIYLELPKSHIIFFNELDEICSELLVNLLNCNTKLEIGELVNSLKIDLNNLENIQYKTILEEGNNILKINVFENTTIKNKNNNILSLDNINPGDYVGILLGLDYVPLLVDNDFLIARTKLYCYFIEIHKQHIYKPEARETINDWNFSSKLSSENIFLKTNITLNDNIDVKTEVETNDKKNNKNVSVISDIKHHQNLSHILESNDNHQSDSSLLSFINSDSEQNNNLDQNQNQNQNQNHNYDETCLNIDDNFIINSDTTSNSNIDVLKQLIVKQTNTDNNAKNKKSIKSTSLKNTNTNTNTKTKNTKKKNTTEQIVQPILVEEQKNIVVKKQRDKKIIVEMTNIENNEKIIKVNDVDNQVKPKRGKKKSN